LQNNLRPSGLIAAIYSPAHGSALATELVRMPRITIQVIPGDQPHAGLLGAFVIAETEQLAAIVYLENASDGQVAESVSMAETMDVMFHALQAEALTGSASLTKIEEAAQRWKEQITP
jgi:hypothetical protein